MTTELQYGQTYHIYNRGNNGENLFRNEENYRYFLRLYLKHFHPIAETYAYCLLPNHFHFAVRIRAKSEILAQDQSGFRNQTGLKQPTPSRKFGNLCVAYTKSINKAYERTGSLFESPFHRKAVHDDAYFYNLITYIHQNPQQHRFVDDFRDWPFTNYIAILADSRTNIARDQILDWFDGKERFEEAHNTNIDLNLDL